MSLKSASMPLILELQEISRNRDGAYETALAHLVELKWNSDGEFCSWLLPLTLKPNRALAAASKEAIISFLRQTSPRKLIKVSENCRPGYYADATATNLRPYHSLGRNDLFGLLGARPFSQHIIGFLTFHPSGFLREAACKRLDPLKGGLPYILLRLNDWVRQVREVANRAISAQWDELTPADWLWNLPLVLRLRECGRADHKEFVTRVINILAAPAARELVEQARYDSDRGVRRECYKLALPHQEDPLQYLTDALKSPDVMVRRWALNVHSVVVPGSEAQFLAELSKCGSSELRSRALQLLHEGEIHNTTLFLDALMDKSGGVRSTARYYLKLQNVTREMMADFCRDQLEQNPVAILALAEVDSASTPVAEAVFAKTGGVWAAQAIIALNPPVERLLKLLNSPRGKVARLTATALSRRAWAPETVFKLCKDGKYPHTKLWALKLVTGKGQRWQRLLWALEALSLRDPILAVRCKELVVTFSSHGFEAYAPPEEARTRWSQLSSKLETLLSKGLRATVTRSLA